MHGDLTIIFIVGGIAQGISFLITGSILVPMLGSRRCLLLGSVIYILAPVLAYVFLDYSVGVLAVCFGGLAGVGVNMVLLPNLLIPVTWFPNSKGKVVGFTMAGFGLSSLVFAPLQTYMINPNNISPEANNNTNGSSGAYFTSQEVLSNLPNTLLWLAAIYGCILVLGFVVCVEKETKAPTSRTKDLERLIHSLKYLTKTAFRNRDFYTLWLTRYTMLTVCAGILTHWKTFCLELSSDDRLISIIGGIAGILNAASRVIAGALLDQFSYRYIMAVCNCITCLCLIALVPTAYASLPGYVALLWLIYFLAFSHFATLPTQVIKLFGTEHSSIILGVIGLADSFALGTVALLNRLFTVQNPFLALFLSMAGFSFLAGVVTFLTREKNASEEVINIESHAYQTKLAGIHQEVHEEGCEEKVIERETSYIPATKVSKS